MIIEGALDVIFQLLKAPFLALAIFDLDLTAVAILGDILKFGVWIVGADLFALVLAVNFGYYSLRLGIGIVEWIWSFMK